MTEINTGLHYPINLDAMPAAWIVNYVGAFCEDIQSGFACGQHSDTDIGVPHLRPMNINREGSLDFNVVKYVPGNYDVRRLSENDVLFNNTNSPELIGKTAYVSYDGAGAAFSNHMTRLRFHKTVLPKFAAFQLHFLWMARYFLHRCVKHVNQASISSSDLAKSIPFVAPPLHEQYRIVAKIEELFSEVDEGIESLETAREQIKIYRQALLKYAFDGKLTQEWREENKHRLESAEALLQRIKTERAQRYEQQIAEWEASGKHGSKPKAPKELLPLTPEERAELPELPEGWVWVRPEDICSPESYSIGIGPFGSNLKVSDYRESGVPLIFVRNITRSDFSLDLKYIDEQKYQELLPHSVKGSDLLITKMGDPPGDCEIYPDNAPIAVLTADCLKFRLWRKYANERLYKFCINSNLVKRQLGVITKGVAQKKISVDRFKTVCFPFFCPEEQQKIVQEIEAKLSTLDQLDQSITQSLQQAEAMRQSILKKAFSGQLVPQDPNDESASALLESIKAEKTAPKIEQSSIFGNNDL